MDTYSPAFIKWQLPSEYGAPLAKSRQHELREDFKRNVGSEVTKASSGEDYQKKQVPQHRQTANDLTQEASSKTNGRSALKVALAQQQLPKAPTESKDVRSHLQSQAQLLLADATPAERSVIQKALKLSTDWSDIGSRQIKDWARTASQSEQRVAADFFQLVAGSGTADDSTRVRAEAAAATLNASSHRQLAGKPAGNSRNNANSDRGSGLRHVRLLSPDTRSNRWRHTAWHSSKPATTAKNANSKASVDTAGHYRIHPEWGWDQQTGGMSHPRSTL